MDCIGDKILNLRKIKGISQEELADLVGVSRQTVSKWESNNVEPSKANLRCLCEVLNVSIKYFYDEDLAYSNDEIEDKLYNASMQVKVSKSIKNLVISLIFLTIITVILSCICVWFGYSVFSTNVGDIAESTFEITLPVFICVLIAALIFSALIILVIILLVRRCKVNANKL